MAGTTTTEGADRSGALSPGQPLLEVADLNITFRTDDGDVQAVRGVDFKIEPGKVLAIVGESGSGKSVTAMSILGLLPPSATVEGSVTFAGEDLLGAKQSRLREIRGAEIAMIFQDPLTALNPVYKVGHQIVEMIQVHERVSKAQARRRAVEMLDLVGIPQANKRIDQYTHEFSGGMRQRAMIAMALSCSPKLIIADEPTTALDVTVQAQVLEVLVDLADRLDTAVVLITHDLGVVAGMADRITVMYAGRMVEGGTVDDVFDATAHPYTAGLLTSLPRLDGDVDAPLVPIGGQPPSMLKPPAGCSFHPRCRWASEAAGCMTEVPATLERTPGHASACHRADELMAADELTRRPTGQPGAGSGTVPASASGLADPAGAVGTDASAGAPADASTTRSDPAAVGTDPVGTTEPGGSGGSVRSEPPGHRVPPIRARSAPLRPEPEDHPDGTTVLVLGILGLVICGLLAPIAWYRGNQALATEPVGPTEYANVGLLRAGRILGIIGTALWVLGLIAFVVFR